MSATQVSTTIHAPRPEVYRAFVDPQVVAVWLAPNNIRGVELIPNEKIVGAFVFESSDPPFAGEVTMTITFADAKAATEVTIRCDNIPEQGIRASLQKLAAWVGIQQLNKSLDQWIAFLERYTIDMLRRLPEPGSWSLGQVYMHLIADTTFYLDRAKAALATADNHDQDMHSFARAMFERGEFPDTRLEGAPSNDHIPQPPSKKELIRDLVAIKDMVNGLPIGDWSGGKSEHPGFQYFTALEWLRFADMHLRHHLRQKQRIDAAVRHH